MVLLKVFWTQAGLVMLMDNEIYGQLNFSLVKTSTLSCFALYTGSELIEKRLLAGGMESVQV